MITTAIVFDHRGECGSRPGPVEVRVTIDRRSFYVNTGIRVLRSNFVAGTIVGQADAAELNERLGIIYTRIQKEVNRCLGEGVRVDVAEVRRRAWQASQEADPDAAPLIEWVERQVPTLGLREGTLRHYRTLVARLREFGGLRRWRDLTVENLYAFDAWLHGLKRPPKRNVFTGGGEMEPIGDATVHNYHKCLKAMLGRAVEFGVIDRNPYDRLKGKFKRGDREVTEYLTEDEMRLFCETRPPRGTVMDVAHDLFVFQMYTGLSYSDTQRFSMEDYRLVGGRWVNTGERVKTGVPYVSQLLPPVVEVLEKYGWQTPKIDNAKYNLCLKALGMVAGISQPLHSHLARHTFATFMLRNGTRIENVSAMLGHTNVKQTQRYARVMALSVHEDFERVAGLLRREG